MAIAVLSASLIARKLKAPSTEGRFASIDGLRGLLAFSVFLHHSCVWYFYLRTGTWQLPPSNLYVHLGQSSVALFFMITGFLFFNKLLEGRTREIDWLKLFVSRILRLTPLYLVVLALLFLVVLLLTKGQLNEPLPLLAKNMMRWLGFTILGEPDLNGVEHTSIIVGGVMWSLPYEWKFYLSLPLLALLLGLRAPLGFLTISLASFLYLEIWNYSIHYLSFGGGIFAAVLVRSAQICQFARGGLASWLAIGCLALTVFAFPTVYEPTPLFVLSLFFTLVAAGNSLYGLLLKPSVRCLGEFAYGIYLIHGLVLFITFQFIIGLPVARSFPPELHWAAILGLTPLLIGLCFLSFRYIEHPAMQACGHISQWLRLNWDAFVVRVARVIS